MAKKNLIRLAIQQNKASILGFNTTVQQAKNYLKKLSIKEIKLFIK